MTVIAKVRFVLVWAGIIVLTSMIVARAEDARTERAAAAIENAGRASPVATSEDFARAAEHYWR